MCPANSFFWLVKMADKHVIYYGDFYDLAPFSQKPFRSYFISKQAAIHNGNHRSWWTGQFSDFCEWEMKI